MKDTLELLSGISMLRPVPELGLLLTTTLTTLSGISMLRPVPEWGLLLTTTLKTEWNLCAEARP